MSRYEFSMGELNLEACRARLISPSVGAYVSFEGWVRDHNEGQKVLRLEYEAYETLGVKEGEKILQDALSRFRVGADG